MIGFEPMTYRIWVCCSCQLSYISIWSRVRESDPHYFSLEGRCHTIRRTLHCVGREGLEPPYCKTNTTICVQTGFTVQRRYLPNNFCSISWNRTKFLWIALQRVLCLRRPSFWQKESICNSTQSWMWFPLLFVSNTLICQQVSVYASPSELVKQVYMPMTTSPVLWAKKDLNLRLPRYQRGTLTIWVTCPLNTIPIKHSTSCAIRIL